MKKAKSSKQKIGVAKGKRSKGLAAKTLIVPIHNHHGSGRRNTMSNSQNTAQNGIYGMPGMKEMQTMMPGLKEMQTMMQGFQGMQGTPNMQNGMQGVVQMMEEVNEHCRALGEASMQSAAALTKGFDEISRSYSGIVQEAMARYVTNSKSLMSVKSPKEAVDLQNDLTKDIFDSWMVGTGKLAEISARISKEVVDPVAQQVNGSISRVMSKGKASA